MGRGGSSKNRQVLAPGRDVCGITDVGCVREGNEDGFHVSEDGRLLMVADGLGGLPAGEVASRLALEAAALFVDENRPTLSTGGVGMKRLVGDAVAEAHQCIVDASASQSHLAGMATTLVVGLIAGDCIVTGHVGDVRGYVLRHSGFEQVTHDHSVVAELVAKGKISEEEALVHPQRSLVTQALGLDGPVAEVSMRKLKRGDSVLLCSDGLWDAMPASDIAEAMVMRGSAEQRATALVDRAIEEGGHDNITAVLYDHK